MLLFTCVLLLLSLGHGSYAWSPFHDPHMEAGRSVIVQMFEWRFDDIANECEQFLGPNGYGGIQVSPPVAEHAIINNSAIQFPWYQRYQIVSYKLSSRSGTRQQLVDMISRCNAAGVRVYIDVIVNHMTANLGKSKGSAGSSFDGDNFDYPAVGYNRSHFNSKEKCGTPDGQIHNWDDFWEARNCELVGLHDLDQSNVFVKEKLINHLNDLIRLGVAGFRVDASKHVYPEALLEIIESTEYLNRTVYGPSRRAFVYHECTEGSGQGIKPQDYNQSGRLLNFGYMRQLKEVLKKWNNQRLAYLKNFGHAWGLLLNNDSVTIIDNHDVQRDEVTLSFKDGRTHKMANVFMLAWPYGVAKIMSSYSWPTNFVGGKDANSWYGPPHYANFTTKRVEFKGDECVDGWVCEHRWRQIYNMVKLRNVAGNAPVDHWWDNAFQQIAFARRGKAFIAINNEEFPLSQWLQTGLPPGNYCDVISGNKKGESIVVPFFHVN